MLKIFDRLGIEDLNRLVYLLGIPEATMKQNDTCALIRYMDHNRIVAPANYDQLESCLQEIGRLDLSELIAQYSSESAEGLALPLQTRESFGANRQLLLLKEVVITDKIHGLHDCIKRLEESTKMEPARTRRFTDLFTKIFSSLGKGQSLAELPQFEKVTDNLQSLSQFWDAWPKALATFQHTGKKNNLQFCMEDCHKYYDEFNQTLPINWEKEMRDKIQLQRKALQHPVGKHARKAHRTLQDLSTELVGQDLLVHSDEILLAALFALESVNYTARYLVPICNWLLELLHSDSSISIDNVTLKLIIAGHWGNITTNRAHLVQIFGEELMTRLKEELEQGHYSIATEQHLENYDTFIHSSLLASTSIIWHVTLIMLFFNKVLHLQVDPQGILTELVHHIAKNKENIQTTYISLSQNMARGMVNELTQYKHRFEEGVQKVAGGKLKAKELLDIVLSLKKTSQV